jgi:hypothetical protein
MDLAREVFVVKVSELNGKCSESDAENLAQWVVDNIDQGDWSWCMETAWTLDGFYSLMSERIDT